jgi:two-component system nitrate/nitrite response regulator NarL
MPIRLVTVSDVRLFRDGLADLLLRTAEFEVVGTAGGLPEVLALLHHPVDVALVDMAMVESLAAVRSLTSAYPQLKIVAVAVPDTEGDIIACAEAGVCGYVSREASSEELMKAIKAAAGGELHCSARIAASLLRRVARLATLTIAEPDAPLLTPRERDVLRLLEFGRSNKEIAKSLGIEVATAKNHVHNILEKLGVRRRADAVAATRRWLARPVGLR